MSPSVFVVDDNHEMLRSLQWLFESVKLPVRTFDNAIHFLECYTPKFQGCLLTDVRMPNMSGLELLDELRARRNLLPIIVMSGHGDIPMAVRALQAGAIDFIAKPLNDQMLLEKIQKIMQKTIRQNHWTDALEKVNNSYCKLTSREQQVLDLIVEGKLNKQISKELNIAISTVEAHRSHVKQKMGVKSLAELVKMHYMLNSLKTTCS